MPVLAIKFKEILLDMLESEKDVKEGLKIKFIDIKNLILIAPDKKISEKNVS